MRITRIPVPLSRCTEGLGAAWGFFLKQLEGHVKDTVRQKRLGPPNPHPYNFSTKAKDFVTNPIINISCFTCPKTF